MILGFDLYSLLALVTGIMSYLLLMHDDQRHHTDSSSLFHAADKLNL